MNLAARIPAIRSQLRTKLASGTTFVLAAVILSNLLRIISTVVTTRLLDASAFGVIGILASVTFVLHMLSDVGLFAFIVRHDKADDPVFLDEVWTLRLLRSVGLMLAMLALAHPVALFTGEPAIGLVLAAASSFFVIEGFSSLAFATAPRRGRVKLLSTLELATMVFQVAVVTALCWWLRSYWGLVIAGALAAAFKSVFSYLLFPGERRHWRFSRGRAKELWTFSRYIASSSALTMIITQADKLVFARILPLSTFGFYTIGTSLATAPTALCAPFNSNILYPGLSQDVRDGKDLRRTFYQRRRNVLLLYAFLVGGLIGAAPLLVELLYDPRYRDVADIVRILAIASLMTLVTSSSNEVMLATHRAKWTFYSNVGRALWLTAGCAVAWSLNQPRLLIWTVGLIEVPATAVYWIGLRRIGALSLRQEALTPIVAAIGLAIGVAGSAPILSWLLAA